VFYGKQNRGILIPMVDFAAYPVVISKLTHMSIYFHRPDDWWIYVRDYFSHCSSSFDI